MPWVGFPWKQKGCEVIPGMVYRSWGSEGRGSVGEGEITGVGGGLSPPGSLEKEYCLDSAVPVEGKGSWAFITHSCGS